ncbi:MAG: hypothetical protein AABZ47_17330, partial [Planctomycetota bacterium]
METVRSMKRYALFLSAGAAFSGFVLPTEATAAILSTGANAFTTVQELIDGAPGSVNRDQKELGVDAATFPLDVSANLMSTDLDGALVALAQGFGMVADPTLSTQANPEEFAIELGCYTNIAELFYSVQSRAIESRSVIFTTPGSAIAPNEIRFRSDGTREIESRTFVSGAVIVWSRNADLSANPVEGELRFLVHRDAEEDVLFSSTLSLDTADGELRIQSTGPLRFNEVGLEELRELGIDEASLAILENVEQQGFLRVIVLPVQEHRYSYIVTADESFDLIATLDAKLRNAPDGSGIAAVLGRP